MFNLYLFLISHTHKDNLLQIAISCFSMRGVNTPPIMPQLRHHWPYSVEITVCAIWNINKCDFDM